MQRMPESGPEDERIRVPDLPTSIWMSGPCRTLPEEIDAARTDRDRGVPAFSDAVGDQFRHEWRRTDRPTVRICSRCRAIAWVRLIERLAEPDPTVREPSPYAGGCETGSGSELTRDVDA